MNMVRALWPEPYVDRRGRLLGNVVALRDLVTGRMDPTRILELEVTRGRGATNSKDRHCRSWFISRGMRLLPPTPYRGTKGKRGVASPGSAMRRGSDTGVVFRVAG